MITIGGKDVADISIGNKNVIRVQDATTLEIMWEKTSQVVDYFYIENTYNGSNSVDILVSSRKPGKYHISELQYSTDKLNWTTYQLSNGSTSITLSQGQRVYFRNDNGYCNTYVSNNYWIMTFNPSQSYIVGGNINSLLDYTNMYNVSLPNYCYYRLFNGSSTLTSSTDLTLVSSTVSDNCYNGMFRNCTSLTTAPELPATTLANRCYGGMFYGCTSLTTAPALPATTLANSCYSNMFSGCTLLNTVTTYADDISASSCLTNWLSYVASSGTFYNNGSATYTIDSASGIPQGWTEVKPPIDYFYIENADNTSGNVSFTFTGTPSESSIQQLEWSKDKTNWTPVTLVANKTTNVPVSVGEKVYFRNDNGKCSNNTDTYINFGSDINTNTGGELYTLLDYTNPNVSLPNYVFYRLFYQMTKLIDASGLVLRWTTLSNSCYQNMFYGCNTLTTAPELPAKTLVNLCYSSMFFDCTSLNSVTTYANDISATFCLMTWLFNVASVGTFYNNGSATYTIDSANGIPRGWTEVHS